MTPPALFSRDISKKSLHRLRVLRSVGACLISLHMIAGPRSSTTAALTHSLQKNKSTSTQNYSKRKRRTSANRRSKDKLSSRSSTSVHAGTKQAEEQLAISAAKAHLSTEQGEASTSSREGSGSTRVDATAEGVIRAKENDLIVKAAKKHRDVSAKNLHRHHHHRLKYQKIKEVKHEDPKHEDLDHGQLREVVDENENNPEVVGVVQRVHSPSLSSASSSARDKAATTGNKEGNKGRNDIKVVDDIWHKGRGHHRGRAPAPPSMENKKSGTKRASKSEALLLHEKNTKPPRTRHQTGAVGLAETGQSALMMKTGSEEKFEAPSAMMKTGSEENFEGSLTSTSQGTESRRSTTTTTGERVLKGTSKSTAELSNLKKFAELLRSANKIEAPSAMMKTGSEEKFEGSLTSTSQGTESRRSTTTTRERVLKGTSKSTAELSNLKKFAELLRSANKIDNDVGPENYASWTEADDDDDDDDVFFQQNDAPALEQDEDTDYDYVDGGGEEEEDEEGGLLHAGSGQQLLHTVEEQLGKNEVEPTAAPGSEITRSTGTAIDKAALQDDDWQGEDQKHIRTLQDATRTTTKTAGTEVTTSDYRSLPAAPHPPASAPGETTTKGVKKAPVGLELGMKQQGSSPVEVLPKTLASGGIAAAAPASMMRVEQQQELQTGQQGRQAAKMGQRTSQRTKSTKSATLASLDDSLSNGFQNLQRKEFQRKMTSDAEQAQYDQDKDFEAAVASYSDEDLFEQELSAQDQQGSDFSASSEGGDDEYTTLEDQVEQGRGGKTPAQEEVHLEEDAPGARPPSSTTTLPGVKNGGGDEENYRFEINQLTKGMSESTSRFEKAHATKRLKTSRNKQEEEEERKGATDDCEPGDPQRTVFLPTKVPDKPDFDQLFDLIGKNYLRLTEFTTTGPASDPRYYIKASDWSQYFVDKGCQGTECDDADLVFHLMNVRHRINAAQTDFVDPAWLYMETSNIWLAGPNSDKDCNLEALTKYEWETVAKDQAWEGVVPDWHVTYNNGHVKDSNGNFVPESVDGHSALSQIELENMWTEYTEFKQANNATKILPQETDITTTTTTTSTTTTSSTKTNATANATGTNATQPTYHPDNICTCSNGVLNEYDPCPHNNSQLCDEYYECDVGYEIRKDYPRAHEVSCFPTCAGVDCPAVRDYMGIEAYFVPQYSHHFCAGLTQEQALSNGTFPAAKCATYCCQEGCKAPANDSNVSEKIAYYEQIDWEAELTSMLPPMNESDAIHVYVGHPNGSVNGTIVGTDLHKATCNESNWVGHDMTCSTSITVSNVAMDRIWVVSCCMKMLSMTDSHSVPLSAIQICQILARIGTPELVMRNPVRVHSVDDALFAAQISITIVTFEIVTAEHVTHDPEFYCEFPGDEIKMVGCEIEASTTTTTTIDPTHFNKTVVTVDNKEYIYVGCWYDQFRLEDRMQIKDTSLDDKIKAIRFSRWLGYGTTCSAKDDPSGAGKLQMENDELHACHKYCHGQTPGVYENHPAPGNPLGDELVYNGNNILDADLSDPTKRKEFLVSSFGLSLAGTNQLEPFFWFGVKNNHSNPFSGFGDYCSCTNNIEYATADDWAGDSSCNAFHARGAPDGPVGANDSIALYMPKGPDPSDCPTGYRPTPRPGADSTGLHIYANPPTRYNTPHEHLVVQPKNVDDIEMCGAMCWIYPSCVALETNGNKCVLYTDKFIGGGKPKANYILCRKMSTTTTTTTTTTTPYVIQICINETVKLRWKVDWLTANRICCPQNVGAMEPAWYFRQRMYPRNGIYGDLHLAYDQAHPMVFYDSRNGSLPVFQIPGRGNNPRNWTEFWFDALHYGWMVFYENETFLNPEIDVPNVILQNETSGTPELRSISNNGSSTHLGYNIPDDPHSLHGGKRYYVNLVCVAGHPGYSDTLYKPLPYYTGPKLFAKKRKEEKFVYRGRRSKVSRALQMLNQKRNSQLLPTTSTKVAAESDLRFRNG
ncbi:unnamed protein product [Amoebophrya sp. A120]|nr:unnamed protein product [Amoebophrya sp. A120]|eukprot:GSA120T00020793001.1